MLLLLLLLLLPFAGTVPLLWHLRLPLLRLAHCPPPLPQCLQVPLAVAPAALSPAPFP